MVEVYSPNIRLSVCYTTPTSKRGHWQIQRGPGDMERGQYRLFCHLPPSTRGGSAVCTGSRLQTKITSVMTLHTRCVGDKLWPVGASTGGPGRLDDPLTRTV